MKLFWVCIVVLGVSTAFADFQKGACKEDVQKFCKDVKPGGGAIVKCLRDHKDELSAGCKANGEAMKEKVREFMAACKEDIKTNCSDVKHGQGRVMECLKASSKTSDTCKAALDKKNRP